MCVMRRMERCVTEGRPERSCGAGSTDAYDSQRCEMAAACGKQGCV